MFAKLMTEISENIFESTWKIVCLQRYRTKTPKQRLVEKFDKSKGTKIPKKPSETKKGNLLTPTTSSMNHHPLSRRYIGEVGRIPIVSSRRESLTGTTVMYVISKFLAYGYDFPAF